MPFDTSEYEVSYPAFLRGALWHHLAFNRGFDKCWRENLTVETQASRHYLEIPSQSSGPIHTGRLYVEGVLRRLFQVRLATGKPDWWAPLDISSWPGERLTLEIDKRIDNSWAMPFLQQTDRPKTPPNLYHEHFRPQFHYSAPYGFELDVEGGVYYKGEYHLFYDWMPTCTAQNAGIWGHAISRDLVHWKHVDTTYPMQGMQDMWSGTVVVDSNNTSGLGQSGTPPIVMFYTKPDFTPPVVIRHNKPGPDFNKRGGLQFMAYSTDGCRTINDYPGNPIVPTVQESLPAAGPNRDPKVFWYEPTKRWFMILYVALPGSNTTMENQMRRA